MQDEHYERKYDEAKKFYWAIKSVLCSCFNNEKIIFHGAGWRHLIFKKGRRRSIEVLLYRFDLLKYAENVIKFGKIIEYREETENGNIARFWKIEPEVNGNKIKVVIKQNESGPKHFFSIMN